MRFCLLFLLIFLSSNYAQSSGKTYQDWLETGNPYVQNFTPREYGENPQNWWIREDDRGLLFIANGHGLLIFDGNFWQNVKTPRETALRSFEFLDNKIYVGAQGEIGYFQPDSIGGYNYTSLKEKIPAEYQDFVDVWQTYVVDDAVYFGSNKTFYRWQNNEFKAWPTKTFIFRTFVHNKEIYLHQMHQGFSKVVGDSLQVVPGGEFFAEMKIYSLLSLDNGDAIIITRNNGLFRYDGNEFTPMNGSAYDFLKNKRVYHAISLNDTLYAMGTTHGGLAIVDKNGDLCQVIDKSTGLKDDLIHHVYKDRQGGVWLALNNGLARIETPAALSRFTVDRGIESTVSGIQRFNGTIYASTHLGIFYLEKPVGKISDQENTPRFRKIENYSRRGWGLLAFDDQLFAATNEGVMRVEGENVRLIDRWGGRVASSLTRSKRNPNRVYVGLFRGMGIMEYDNNQWKNLGLIPGVKGRATNIAEDANGVLWVGNGGNGAYRVEDLNPNSIDFNPEKDTKVQHFGREANLPYKYIHTAVIDGKVYAATQKGLRSYDKTANLFQVDSTFGAHFADTTTWVFFLTQDRQKNVWLVGGRGKAVFNGVALRQPDGSYRWEGNPFERMNDMGDMFVIYPEKDNSVWFGGSEGVARYTTHYARKRQDNLTAMIRRVAPISSGSAVFGGSIEEHSFSPTLGYENNSLRFEYAFPTFDDVSANQFQVKLEGFDADWSGWTSEKQKDYTGLPEGTYIFKVRGKNIYGTESKEGSFSFTIMPPLHRSIWAYLAYLLLLVGAISLFVKLRVRSLEKKSEYLESIVTRRTNQVVEQRNQLMRQSEKLQELDRLKSRFFANISHEFRTPLTLLLGMLDKFDRKGPGKKFGDNVKIMQRNASRLLQLINQLLDLSKLEAGGMQLQVTRGDIVLFIRRLVLSFTSLCEEKNISLRFNGQAVGEDNAHIAIKAYYDSDKLEKIFYNLLSNAFKFTPSNGIVDVHVAIEQADDEMENEGIENNGAAGENNGSGTPENTSDTYVAVRVKNTGVGIPADKLPHVFDRFFQGDDVNTRRYEGSGIGLALVKELVTLHGGNVTADSESDGWTTFAVRLPLSRKAFRDEDFAPEAETEETAKLTETARLSLVTEKAVLNNGSDRNDTAAVPPDASGDDATMVLIVEDHRDLRDFIREQLAEKYTVVEAADGAEGLEKAVELIPDLVISDIMMPKMDGYALCAALKKNDKTNHIPVILLTAKAASGHKIAGLEKGADDYLIKPFNPEELNVRVRNLIKIRQQMRDKFSSEIMLKPADVTVKSVNQEFLEKLLAIIEAHIEDEAFSVAAFADNAGLSRVQLHRKLRALTGQSPSEFIRAFRLERAANLLKNDAGNIAEIAYMVGFNSQAYFTRCFQEKFGCTPSEYRKK